jgi:putative endonuclease
MTTARRGLGDLGERLAVHHLLANGYRIRARNVRTRFGEIDIVAEKDQLLAFVEVKTRRGDFMGTATESIPPVRWRRLVALAEAFGQGQDDLPPERRIDLIALDLTANGKLTSLRHIEGAVWGE